MLVSGCQPQPGGGAARPAAPRGGAAPSPPPAGLGGCGGGGPAGPRATPPGRRALPPPWPSSPAPAGPAAAGGPGARPPGCDALTTGRHGGEAVVEGAPRGGQRWAARIRAGPPHGRPGAPPAGGFRRTPSCEAPGAGAAPTPTLFEGVLGLAVGVLERLGGLTEVRTGTPVGWPSGAHRRDGPAEGAWASRPEADHGPRHLWTHGPEQDGEGRGGRRPPPAGQEACPGEAVAEAPPPLRAAGRGEAREGQQAPALGWGPALPTGGSREGEGAQGGGAREPRQDGPWGHGHPPGAPGRRDGRPTPGRRGAQGPDVRPDLEAQRRLGQGEPSRCCRAGRAGERWTGPLETAPAVAGERHDVCQGRARTIVMRGGPPRLPAAGAMTPQRLAGTGGGGARTSRRPCHGKPFPSRYAPLYQYRTTNVELILLS